MAVIIGVLVEHHRAVRSARQNKCLAAFFHPAALITKYAACLDGVLVDINHPPRSPQLLHVVASSSSLSNGFPSTLKRNSLPTLKNGTRFAATETNTPLLGLRPWRARRCFTTKLPKPRISMRSPSARASTIESTMAL